MLDAQYLVVYMVVVKITPKYLRNITTKRFKSTGCGHTRALLFFFNSGSSFKWLSYCEIQRFEFVVGKSSTGNPDFLVRMAPQIEGTHSTQHFRRSITFYKYCIVKRPGRILCS